MTQRFLFAFCLLLASCSSTPEATSDAASATADAKAGVKAAKAAVSKEASKVKQAVEKKADEAAGSAAAAGTVTCKSGKDERTLSVAGTEGGGCEVKYTKFGQESTPGNSANGMEYCNQVSEKIQKNLIAAGYKCE
jgi:hypothetical protein